MSNESEDTEMRYDKCVDTTTPRDIPLCGKYKRSFAYVTVKDRLPVILTQIIDHLSRDRDIIVKANGKQAVEELKDVVGKFSKLKNELQTNKTLLPVLSDSADVDIWNRYLERQKIIEGTDPRWYDSPWLYIECYMYRRVREAFELTKSLSTFDPFRKKKEDALINSLAAIDVLSLYVSNVLQLKDRKTVESEFYKLLHVNVWGNRCDLSISIGQDVIVHEDPLKKMIELKEFVLTDKTDDIWTILKSHKGKPEIIVDIVLDNAGYELYTDLCLADFLVSFSLATKIRFWVKAIPWYISDTCLPDFQWTLQKLSESQNKNISYLAERWKNYISSKKWMVEVNTFWTTPYSFCEMNSVDPVLYADLAKSILVIFKGDLNYRKLLGDINWEPTKPFSEALRGFHPTNIAALRTLKADLISGLAPGQAEEIQRKSPDWLISGQYAVIHFSKSH